MTGSRRKNALLCAAGVGTLTLAAAVGLIAYSVQFPAAGAFWGLGDLQSGIERGAYSESQAFSPEAHAADSGLDKVGSDPPIVLSEATDSAAGLPKPARASGTDPDIILLAGNPQFEGGATANPGAVPMSTADASPYDSGIAATSELPALGGGVGAGSPSPLGYGIPNGGPTAGPGNLPSVPISGPAGPGSSPSPKPVNPNPGTPASTTPAPPITPPTIQNPGTGAPAASTAPPGGSPTSSAPPQAPLSGPSAAVTGPTSPTVSSPGGTPQNPIIPISTLPNGSETLPIGAGCIGTGCSAAHAWQFFDPPVAIGYDYELKPSVPGQNLTFGVTDIMVTTKVGSGVYDLWLYDVLTHTYVDASKFARNGQEVTITADPTANPSGAFDLVKFLAGLSTQQDKELGITDPDLGLSQFSIRGIDPNAGLDPDNPNSFITGLLFTGDINGNLFITPLAIDSTTGLPVDPPTDEIVLPEPTSLILFATALALLAVFYTRAARRSQPPAFS